MASPPAPDASSSASARNTDSEARSWLHRIRNWIATSAKLHAVVIGILAIALVALVVAHFVIVSGIHRQEANARAAVVRSAAQTLTDETSALLRLSALPLGWAIRSALLKDDFGAADAYVQRIVQEKHVTGVALVTPDGKVRLAGSRKLEGRPAAEAFPGVALNESAPAISSANGQEHVTVPIMAIDRRLGTLIFSYATPTPATWETSSGRR